VIESGHDDQEPGWDDWDLEAEDFEALPPPPWRKPLLIAVAAVTAIAMALVPVYNVFFDRPVADNGLEICGFDYCVVQEAVIEAGVDQAMSRLANTFLDEDGARALSGDLTEYLDIRPVAVHVVDELDGRLGGVYEPATRIISIESPARAWTVLHEVAHAVESGHGNRFREVVIDLTREMESRE
jgi:hypothetical protein